MRTMHSLPIFLLILGAAALGGACSAGDPGVDNLSRPKRSAESSGTIGTDNPGGGNGTGNGDGDGTGGGNGNGTGGGTGNGDGGGGGTGPTDAGAGAEVAAQVTAFSGAPTYQATLPQVRAEDRHAAAGQPKNAGKPCLDCHNGTGAPKFAFAGTIYGPGGAAPAARAEIRVIDPQGTQVGTTHSDLDGNFWLAGGATIPAGSKSGARAANGTDLMVGTIASGNCNTTGCHTPALKITVK